MHKAMLTRLVSIEQILYEMSAGKQNRGVKHLAKGHTAKEFKLHKKLKKEKKDK